MTAARLVLWRHGQTDWNRAGRYQGQADVPLNDTGRRQAAAAAPHVAALGPTRIIASDLGRAVETAGALAAVTGLPVVQDARFREIHVGSWAGLTNDEAFVLDRAFQAALREGRDHRRSPEGETATEVGERMAAALLDVAAQADDGEVVVVATHGLAARMAVATVLGLGWEGSQALAGVRNCSWSVLDHAHGRWRLGCYNVEAGA